MEQYPNFFEQIKNLSTLAGGVAKDFVEGEEVFASEEKQKNRMELCENCEYYDSNQKRCKLCGCFMEAKVKFLRSSCPALKW